MDNQYTKGNVITTDIIQAIFEGIIGILVVGGGGALIFTSHPLDPAIAGVVGGAIGVVLTFFYGQRQVKTVQNGQLTALSQISAQMSAGREQAAETANAAMAQSTTAIHEAVAMGREAALGQNAIRPQGGPLP